MSKPQKCSLKGRETPGLNPELHTHNCSLRVQEDRLCCPNLNCEEVCLTAIAIALVDCAAMANQQAAQARIAEQLMCLLAEQTVDDLPYVKAWMQRIAERPAVQRGIDTPDKFDRELTKNPEKVKEMIDHVRSWNKPKA